MHACTFGYHVSILLGKVEKLAYFKQDFLSLPVFPYNLQLEEATICWVNLIKKLPSPHNVTMETSRKSSKEYYKTSSATGLFSMPYKKASLLQNQGEKYQKGSNLKLISHRSVCVLPSPLSLHTHAHTHTKKMEIMFWETWFGSVGWMMNTSPTESIASK